MDVLDAMHGATRWCDHSERVRGGAELATAGGMAIAHYLGGRLLGGTVPETLAEPRIPSHSSQQIECLAEHDDIFGVGTVPMVDGRKRVRVCVPECDTTFGTGSHRRRVQAYWRQAGMSAIGAGDHEDVNVVRACVTTGRA